MERKIGEIFEFGGEWYQCVESPTCNCKHCDFYDNKHDLCHISPQKCLYRERSDKKDVIFKKLDKVGEPIQGFQRYKLAVNKVTYSGKDRRVMVSMPSKTLVYIEIKQTKEDMEENKLNLKPFDIQKAREGKPVCTRGGRKARIICFDRISGDDYYKIVACVTAFDGDFEEVLFYGIDGYIVDSQNPKDEDLMMLPEKKEGWAKVRKDINLYDTKEEADRKMIGNDEYVTAKVCWEE